MPFNLECGLFLEARKTLLAWDADLSALKLSADHDSHGSLYWNDETIFDGLPVHAYMRSTEWLPNVVFLTPRRAEPFRSAQDAYEWLAPRLTQRLGSPEATADVENRPSLKWTFGKVRFVLHLLDRFGPEIGFNVAVPDGDGRLPTTTATPVQN